MKKRIFFLVLGFILMGTGVNGIVSYQKEQKRMTLARELDRARSEEAAKAAAAEEQKRVEAERLKVEQIAMQVQAEKTRLENEKREIEEKKSQLRAEAARQQKLAEKQQASLQDEKKAASKDRSTTKPAVARKTNQPQGGSTIAEGSRGRTAPAPRTQPDIKREPKYPDGRERVASVRLKAAREAASSMDRIIYRNEATGERITAEPYDFTETKVRIRIQTWEHGRMVHETYKEFPRLYCAY